MTEKVYLEQIKEKLNNLSPDELKEFSLSLAKENYKLEQREKERKRSDEEMSLQYQQKALELEAANKEIARLVKQLSHYEENNSRQNDRLFGRKTEQLGSLLNMDKDDQPTDPLDEDSDGETPEETSGNNSTGDQQQDNPGGAGQGNTGGPEKTPKPRKPKEKGAEDRMAACLPAHAKFVFEPEEYDRKYGKDRWRVCRWHKHIAYDVIPASVRIIEYYTPVIVPLDHPEDVVSEPYEQACLPGTRASAGLLSMIINDKFSLYVPLNRQDKDVWHFGGLNLSRQRLTRWVNQAATDLLKPVWEEMLAQLLTREYIQIDETTYLVIDDGRDGIHKSYIWIQRSSELSDEPEIIVYSYEPTRSAQHLRDLFVDLKNRKNITCDAYSAYNTIAKELLSLITLGGCFAHSRRRFVSAFMLLRPKTKGADMAQFLDYDEVKAIQYIAEIYAAEEALRGLSPKERHQRRQSEVKPLVDKFFDFIHSLDSTDAKYSDKMKDAINYAINQEETLRRFLDNGEMPIDNSATERNVKPVASIRNNSRFSFSITGAEANCICHTLVETSKANGADPRIYIEYVAERMSRCVYYGYAIDIKDMMPWSESYLKYEKAEIERRRRWRFPEDEECPTPVKPKEMRAA